MVEDQLLEYNFQQGQFRIILYPLLSYIDSKGFFLLERKGGVNMPKYGNNNNKIVYGIDFEVNKQQMQQLMQQNQH